MARPISERSRRPSPRRKNVPILPAFPPDLPLLPIRDNVHFPKMIFPLFVGREKSVRAMDEAMSSHQHILLATQREVGTEDPEPEELYGIGIVAEVMQILKVPDGTVRVMLEGIERVRITEYLQVEPFFYARTERLPVEEYRDIQAEALMRSVITQFEQIVNIGKNIPPEAVVSLFNIEEPGRLADHIAWHLPSLRVETKQDLLETLDAHERLEKLSVLLKKEFEILEIQKNIRNRVEKEMGDTQREFILREQLKAIQQELGERDDRQTEIEEYRTKVLQAIMPEAVGERAYKEIDRLEKMPYAAPEGVVIRTYLDTLIALPWSKSTEEVIDIEAAEAILHEDHYGLPKVKERILEFLAVRKLTGTLKGPILCFVGPPGVGKTSLGKSIARALGRKFIRISLGGIRDEAEIRGHRRTYIGALPGRILQGLKHTGVNNPVFMLDEIDKMGSDFRGDPSSALLEALDPEQNTEFSDHYLEVPFDLRDVMFITTANLLDPIPPALRDRMEVISFTGYTEDEKVEIARKFLIPKQTRDNGLPDEYLAIPEAMIRRVIREHTREAGVRNFERAISTICRKVARALAQGSESPVCVGDEEIRAFLGQRKYHYGLMEEKDEVGAATGLVYTESGGDVISIEVSLMRGKDGRLTLTGQLGDVMKESAQAALSFIRSRARALDIEEDFYERTEIHIHVPAGAIPKDGPSAGITMATAMASALTRRPVRKEIAMTGEITLRGRVLPIGGLKEKVLAAHRAGIRVVILPRENERDLEDLPENIRRDMTFQCVDTADKVLELALM
jgi:ATP-dependent Lon protease